jgi:molybdopterin-guanine dinucleotide biosynthesis protein B
MTEAPHLAPSFSLPIIGFVGSSGSGKTTLVTGVVRELTALGVKVGALKHARHGFDLDSPGKDSHRAREAGAARIMIASRDRWVLMGEEPVSRAEPPFRDLVARLASEDLDLILAEGFAGEAYPKIEVYRPAHGRPPKCWPHDPHVVAVASDAPVPVSPPVSLLDLNVPATVTEFILGRLEPGRLASGVFHAA